MILIEKEQIYMGRIMTGIYRGLHYKYNLTKLSLEFTKGKVTTKHTAHFCDDLLGIGKKGNSSLPNGSKVKAIKFDDIDMSNVTDMSNMFQNYINVRTIDLGNSFNTNNVTTMQGMFVNNFRLQSINLGNHFNTSNVTNMDTMFYANTQLRSLNLGDHFDTGNVTDMDMMFSSDNKLPSIDLGSKFNTNKVTNMYSMFSADSSLQSLTLPNSFDTSNVKNMGDMFSDDYNLHSLNLGKKFTFGDDVLIYKMFMGVSNLTLTIPKTLDMTNIALPRGTKIKYLSDSNN